MGFTHAPFVVFRRLFADKQKGNFANAERKLILWHERESARMNRRGCLKMARVYNFSAGPAVLPEEVLKQAADEMLEYRDSGMSVMEMSHRSAAFTEIITTAESDLRELMGIPDNYKVLFLQGGDSLLFASVFMNLARNGKADYIVTGNWSKKAYQEAQILGDPKLLATGADDNFSKIPDLSDLDIRDDASYIYICENETVHGNRIHSLPNTKGHVLVADQSSMFLSEPVDVSKYGLIHAGVQKNVGPSGTQIVIVREDLIADDLADVPTMLRFKTHAEKGSLYNTPPCYGIYICGLVFKWIKGIGGLDAMKERNEKKAKLLYDFLDASSMFKGTVVPEDRSIMNVPFVTGDDELDKKFIAAATAAGFANIKGHRSVGGMRASIYNAMPVEGVEKLVEFMGAFEAQN
jgi:phosphoserine aminotransferase